jgi:DNA polymerase V
LLNVAFLAAASNTAGVGGLQTTLYATTVSVIMPNLPVFSSNPVPVQSNPMLLHVCGWAVPAGFPSPAADHAQKRIDLNKHLIRNGDATYVFRVAGDSMMGIGIYEGDRLLIDRSIEPKHNNIVLAVLNSEFTVKRLYKRGGVVKLIAENPIYPPIVIKEADDFTVWGVVTYNLHKLL